MLIEAAEKLAVHSPRLHDLKTSFPALLVALATGYGTPRARARARLLVEKGAPLRKIARLIGLPWWLRKLPPEAFTKSPGPLPDTPYFNRRIANHIPGDAVACSVWLRWVSQAYRSCDEKFALWMARAKSTRQLLMARASATTSSRLSRGTNS